MYRVGHAKHHLRFAQERPAVIPLYFDKPGGEWEVVGAMMGVHATVGS